MTIVACGKPVRDHPVYSLAIMSEVVAIDVPPWSLSNIERNFSSPNHLPINEDMPTAGDRDVSFGNAAMFHLAANPWVRIERCCQEDRSCQGRALKP